MKKFSGDFLLIFVLKKILIKKFSEVFVFIGAGRGYNNFFAVPEVGKFIIPAIGKWKLRTNHWYFESIYLQWTKYTYNIQNPGRYKRLPTVHCQTAISLLSFQRLAFQLLLCCVICLLQRRVCDSVFCSVDRDQAHVYMDMFFLPSPAGKETVLHTEDKFFTMAQPFLMRCPIMSSPATVHGHQVASWVELRLQWAHSIVDLVNFPATFPDCSLWCFATVAFSKGEPFLFGPKQHCEQGLKSYLQGTRGIFCLCLLSHCSIKLIWSQDSLCMNCTFTWQKNLASLHMKAESPQ